jgi:hypothetical protein
VRVQRATFKPHHLRFGGNGRVASNDQAVEGITSFTDNVSNLAFKENIGHLAALTRNNQVLGQLAVLRSLCEFFLHISKKKIFPRSAMHQRRHMKIKLSMPNLPSRSDQHGEPWMSLREEQQIQNLR